MTPTSISHEELRRRLDVLLEVAAPLPGDHVKCIAQDAGSTERRYADYGVSDDDRQALVAWALSPTLRYLDVRHVPGSERVASVLGLWCERGAEQQVREFLGPLVEDAIVLRDTYYLRVGIELPSGETPVCDALKESLRVVERVSAVLHTRTPWRYEPGSGRVLDEDEADELLARLAGRTEPAGVARARARLEAARVPTDLLSARDARKRIVEILGVVAASPDDQTITVLAVTMGAGKSTGTVDYACASPEVRLAYLAPMHEVAKDMFGRFGGRRPAVRRYGIISATDDAGAPLCFRIDTAEKIVERGGAPAVLMCHLCPEAPTKNGACRAFGGCGGDCTRSCKPNG